MTRTIPTNGSLSVPALRWRFPNISHRHVDKSIRESVDTTDATPKARKQRLERGTLENDAYDAMVFSSGGSRGIAHLGAIDMLERQTPGTVGKCRYFIGSSAGAVVATMLAMGITAKDGMDAFIVPFRYKKDIRLHLMSTLFGIEGGKSLEDFLETVVPKDVTFKDILDEHGTVLSVIGSNLNTSSAEIFDAIRTPTMSVFSALRISCAVPLLFTAVRMNNQYYVDGAITNPFPLSVASEIYGCRRILGLRFDTYATALDTTAHHAQPWTLDYFLGAVVDTLIHSSTLHVPARRGVITDVCTIQTPNDVTGISFDISPEKKFEIYDAGGESMLTFLKKMV
jgi:predicted acylesterase/phospholipase RssA